MRAVDGRDRVELDAAEPPDRRRDVGGARAAEPRRVALVRDDVAPQLGDGDRLHASASGRLRSGRSPGRAGDALEPRLRRRVGREVEAALLGDVRVRVDRDVRDREGVADEPVAAGEVALDRVERAVAAAPLRRPARPRTRPARRGSRSRSARRRGTARPRTARRTSTGGRGRARAGRSGTYSVPSARYQRIAFDSARCSPSSSSSVGTRSAGFLPPRISAPVRAVEHVDLDPLVLDAAQREDLPHLPAVPRELRVVEASRRRGSTRGRAVGNPLGRSLDGLPCESESARARSSAGARGTRAGRSASARPRAARRARRRPPGRCSRRSAKTWSTRVAHVDGAGAAAASPGDLLAERVRVAEDAVEQAALVQRADHVGERLGRRVADDRELRDPVALHQLDRRAELLVRLADDEVGQRRRRACLYASTCSTVSARRRAARGSRARASSCRRRPSRGSRGRRRGSWSGSSSPGP